MAKENKRVESIIEDDSIMTTEDLINIVSIVTKNDQWETKDMRKSITCCQTQEHMVQINKSVMSDVIDRKYFFSEE